jgi:hypothetical protein
MNAWYDVCEMYLFESYSTRDGVMVMVLSIPEYLTEHLIYQSNPHIKFTKYLKAFLRTGVILIEVLYIFVVVSINTVELKYVSFEKWKWKINAKLWLLPEPFAAFGCLSVLV